MDRAAGGRVMGTAGSGLDLSGHEGVVGRGGVEDGTVGEGRGSRRRGRQYYR
jgi:hypothetical protein